MQRGPLNQHLGRTLLSGPTATTGDSTMFTVQLYQLFNGTRRLQLMGLPISSVGQCTQQHPRLCFGIHH